jgi:hypothetical protein
MRIVEQIVALGMRRVRGGCRGVERRGRGELAAIAAMRPVSLRKAAAAQKVSGLGPGRRPRPQREGVAARLLS